MKAIVVAYDLHRGIGANNDLLWLRDLPADLSRFKRLTMGGSVIMGRKTYESIGRALPGRKNIIVTHGDINNPETTVVDNLHAAYDAAGSNAYVIGGGSIYEQSLGDMDVIYATEVKATFPEATVFFPDLDDSWQETSREQHEADEKNKYAYDFVTYERA